VQACSGAAAGFVSTLLTNPLEIVRTRLQIDTTKAQGGLRLTGQFLLNIYKKEGIYPNSLLLFVLLVSFSLV
jgi:hypothetical protein